MLPTFDVPAIWRESGTPQRYVGTAVKIITLGANEQGFYIQVLTQNIRITIGAVDPRISPNSLGFQILAGAVPVLFVGSPGQEFRILQEAATAEVQYQMLTLAGRFK